MSFSIKITNLYTLYSTRGKRGEYIINSHLFHEEYHGRHISTGSGVINKFVYYAGRTMGVIFLQSEKKSFSLSMIRIRYTFFFFLYKDVLLSIPESFITIKLYLVSFS